MIDLNREEDLPQLQPHVLVQVTNRNAFAIRDRYDGVPVIFKPNETVSITQEQARHFFGYPGDPIDMAIHMAKRFGWNTLEYTYVDPADGPEGPTRYQKQAWLIEFKEQEFELVPKGTKNADDGVDEVEDLPAGAPPPGPGGNEPRATTRSGKGKHASKSRRRPPRAKPAADPVFNEV